MIIHKITSRIKRLTAPKFSCPICDYQGSFIDVNPKTGYRKYSRCPQCGSAERHRLQKLVLERIFKELSFQKNKILHFAPESFFQSYFQDRFEKYISCDLYRDDVTIQGDITNLPFADNEFDFIFASHVLEHIQNDMEALKEIKRVLKPKCVAILPVPVVSEQTIEYPEPNPHETNHVRACGKDYFERYKTIFPDVKLYNSYQFPIKYQTFLYENRSHYPNKYFPLREPSYQDKYEDIVPICINS